jgi:hypothetical protein
MDKGQDGKRHNPATPTGTAAHVTLGKLSQCNHVFIHVC